ncbi:hypothetical protein ACROYT_G018481 [Oculina patagonica]
MSERTSFINQMANFKVAAFIALIVVLSQTAYSNSAPRPDCEDDCYTKSYFCRLGCSHQECANDCSRRLNACYETCGVKGKREFNRPLSRDASEEEGFYDEFQK